MPTREIPEKFLVAFSLAGEHRSIVKPVAEEVERRLGRSLVFYDEWYEHYLAGREGDVKLQEIYLNRCELAVACISSRYADKPWTTIESEAIRTKYMQATGSAVDRDRVLPLRVGDGDVPGILLNTIVKDLRETSVDEAATFIIDRLQLVLPKTVDHSDSVQWPDEEPQLRWPMADHSEARAAYAKLLTRSSQVQLLCVAGPSDTGKSHMSKQMVMNCAHLPNVRCGRFDFKGTIGMELMLEAFVRSLRLNQPDAPSLTAQFSKVLSDLCTVSEPTVLILDTYEQAGEAADWVENVLLPELLNAPWLRVVILGQEAPSRAGRIWESMAESAIRLKAPGPEHWLAYGREQRPDEEIDLEFVTKVHEISGGKPTTLASLFGPR